ncbi:MAG: hypothetical protein C0168_02710 [Candidatus Aminicenantes bacterium]|nr:MAG: hypothetical protein C0168_02710 [Candidatus Aminicenantes bacterium]
MPDERWNGKVRPEKADSFNQKQVSNQQVTEKIQEVRKKGQAVAEKRVAYFKASVPAVKIGTP